MMPEWVVILGLISGTVVPISGLLLTLHDRNVKRTEQAQKNNRKRHKAILQRMDHLDDCVDKVRQRVERLEGRRHGDASFNASQI
jgi:hypothetical protein